jgi:hypothetical protein
VPFQIWFRDESHRLPDNRVKSALIDFVMNWNGQSLTNPAGKAALQLDVTTPLRDFLEPEPRQNS